ncbi:hypothetical protein [Acinetobacter towneri]|uniref:hypothetical protein n=1 Tax=Acinetobacter towneri TaxID=202956 RepID=UPI00209835DC|nr:hypothetical protein [Acinetobacter towneri]MCO8055203.1 hypothetical protein [Acinetobacter towneri]MCO8057730.1 hypothetical protein [Acinetobacter towneri]
MKNKLEIAKGKMESKDPSQLKVLNSHDVTDAMLQAVVQSYFSFNDSQDKIQGKQSGVISNSMMSFGTFSTVFSGVYSWGVLRNVNFGNMVMDIDRISLTQVNTDNNHKKLLSFVHEQGMRQSYNENQIPEQFFNNPYSSQKNVDGISAVKALHIANSEGQRIYQINKQNINTILPKINHDSAVIEDIRNAVAAGKVVTTSEKSIAFNGWKGSGYIILDPNNGSGAYMISGGENGGFVTVVGFAYLFLGLILLTIALSSLFLAVLTGGATLLVTVAAIVSSIIVIMKGLSTLSPDFANDVCAKYGPNLMLGTISTLVAAFTSNVLPTLATAYMGVSTNLSSFLSERICGV